jgi:hypothetical protein
MNVDLKADVLSNAVGRAEKSTQNVDADSFSKTHSRRPLEQKKRRAPRALGTSTSERKPRHAKSKIDDRNSGAQSEGSLKVEADELDTLLPLRPASPLSLPATSRREPRRTLRLSRYGAGPRNDPFSAYPIPAVGDVPHAVDVCKNNPVFAMIYEEAFLQD